MATHVYLLNLGEIFYLKYLLKKIKIYLTCQQDVVSQQNVIDELCGDVRRYV